MCGPFISVAIGAIGSLASGAMGMMQANYQAKVAKYNAEAAMREGFAQAGATRDEYRTVKGQQAVGLAKAGVDVNAGTAGVLGIETQRREEVAAAVDIWRARTEATKWNNQAAAAKAEGMASMIGGVIGAVSGVVGGMGNMGQGQPMKLGQAAPAVTGTATESIAKPGVISGSIPVKPWKPKNRGMY